MKKKIVSLAVLFMSLTINAQQNISIFYATIDSGEANPVKQFPLKSFTGKISWGHDIEVLPDFTFQTIEGIGGAFNEIGGEALLSLDKQQQTTVLNNLFGADNTGFSFCRTAIGASDFSLDAYSYSEVAEDYEMKKFSIERDKKYVIPYIKSAIAVNPKLKIFGSPWSPPAWMKENGQMAGVDDIHSKLRSDKKVYKAYAMYFSKYIKAYQDNGINISRICVQNETDVTSKYPSCLMPPSQLLELGLDFIKPQFSKDHITTEVYAGTFRVAKTLEMAKYLMLPNALKLDGIGVQYTDARYITEVQIKYSNKPFMHTEGNCFDGKNSVKQAESRLEEISNYINSNCTNYCYWNMILNETTKSGWDWNQNSLINIDRTNKTVTYNPDYNVMCLVSKFIKPGDVRVASTASRNPIISVKDKNGNIKIIIQNNSTEEVGYQLKLENKEVTFTLPARAISAIIINK